MIPALDAVKIRCLSRRTSSSTRRHSMACQSKGCVLRSCHHAHCARGVNLSSGSGASIIFLSTGSPDRVKSSFASGHQARYPVGFPKRPPGGGGQHVPVSRRLSAACIRFSVILARRGGLAAERRQEQSNGDAQARSGGHATRVLDIRSLTPTTPVGTTRSRSTRRGWIRWAEPLIEVRADVHRPHRWAGTPRGAPRDLCLAAPLAGGWSTPEYGAKGEFWQL